MGRSKEEEKEAKNLRQQLKAEKKTEVIASRLKNSRVLFVVGGDDFCSCACDQSEATIASENSPTSSTKMKDFAAWLLKTPLHRHCLVELMSGSRCFDEFIQKQSLDNPIFDFNDPNSVTHMEGHVKDKHLQPLCTVVPENDGHEVHDLPSFEADGIMSFDICHVNLLLGHMHSAIAGDQATVAFVKQSSFLSLFKDKPLLEFLAANFDVVCDGHDRTLCGFRSMTDASVAETAAEATEELPAEELAAEAADETALDETDPDETAPAGEISADELAAVAVQNGIRGVWEYLHVWSSFVDKGCGMCPPPFQQHFYSDKVQRDRVFRSAMLPFVFARLVAKDYIIGDEIKTFDSLTWLDLGEHFWKQLHAKNTQDVECLECLEHETFLQSNGIVIKPTKACRFAFGVCFVKVDKRQNPPLVTACDIQGETFDFPMQCLKRFGEAVVKVEPFNDEVKGHECSFFYKCQWRRTAVRR